MTSSQDHRPGRAPAAASPSGPAPTIRLRDPAGVVAAVPYLLGFVPRRSLAVVGVRRDGMVGPTVRCDLDLAGLAEAAGQGRAWPGWEPLQHMLVRNGCRTGLVVVYADHDPADLPTVQLDALLDLVRSSPDDDGARLEVLDVVLVGPSRFRSLRCVDAGCCPAEGDPVDEAAGHAVAASFVLSGRSPAPDRDEVQPPDRCTTRSDRSTARAAARRAGSRRRAAGPTANGREDLRLFEQWCRCLEEHPRIGPDPVLAGRLAAGWCRSTRLRDACLAVFLPGGPCSGLEVLVGSSRSDDVFGALVEQPSCAGSERPAGPVLGRLAALVTGRDRAAVLAAHAWLCWVSGDGTAALVLAERALQDDPSQRLATLVGQCLQHGLGAPWTRPGPWT